VIINKLSKGAVGFSVAAAMTIGALVAAICFVIKDKQRRHDNECFY
jgi:VIT1/CCC1 family predicted Fe2+/Mn2+ transporter